MKMLLLSYPSYATITPSGESTGLQIPGSRFRIPDRLSPTSLDSGIWNAQNAIIPEFRWSREHNAGLMGRCLDKARARSFISRPVARESSSGFRMSLRASVGSTDASASLPARVGVVGPKRARRLTISTPVDIHDVDYARRLGERCGNPL
jgi:hypothetical protein